MPEETTQRQLVVFTLGTEEYALPITEVHEIIAYAEPRSVASSVASLRGVISLRGKIVAVHDVAGRLGMSSSVTEQSKIVIVDTGVDIAGIIVDDVQEVLTVQSDQIVAVPNADVAMIDGVAQIGDRLVIVLRRDAIAGGEVALAA